MPKASLILHAQKRTTSNLNSAGNFDFAICTPLCFNLNYTGVYGFEGSPMAEIDSLKPDICFLDIDMPEMTGLEVLDALQARCITTYPVIISGHSTAENLKTAVGKGAKGFVVKPYTFDKIKQITERFFNTYYKMHQ